MNEIFVTSVDFKGFPELSDCSAVVVLVDHCVKKHMQKLLDRNLMLYFWTELYEDQLLFVESDGDLGNAGIFILMH